MGGTLFRKISQTEVGFNIPISIPFSELSPKIVSYGTHRIKKIRGKGRTIGNYGTSYFGKRDCDFRLKIYDKLKDIEDKTDAFDIDPIPNISQNIMRIEFTFDNKATFNRKGLPNINNLNRIIKYWHKLYELWAKEVGRITILNNISDTQNLSLKDILLAETLNLYPWKDNIADFEEYLNTHYKNQNTFYKEKSKLFRTINLITDNYGNPNEYNKLDFYKDIIRYFTRQKENNEKINIPLMIANLHSSTKYLYKITENPS